MPHLIQRTSPMLVTRKNLMDKILTAEKADLVEPILKNALKQIIDNGTHPHLLGRFLERFESDLLLQLAQQHTENELSNLKEALSMLHSRDSSIKSQN